MYYVCYVGIGGYVCVHGCMDVFMYLCMHTITMHALMDVHACMC